MAKVVAGKHSRQTIRLAQALKETAADDPAGTGLEEQPQMSAGLAAKQAADEVGRPSPCSAGWWRECGGAGTQEAGSDLPTCLPPTYRLCLSLSIPTPLI